MIKVGDRLPEGSFRVKQDDDSVKEVPVSDLFKGQKVVFVGVPGAFTSTCHKAHIPQFVTHASELKAKGVDRIVVMAVNDHHVMRTWGESLGGHGKIDFVCRWRWALRRRARPCGQYSRHGHAREAVLGAG